MECSSWSSDCLSIGRWSALDGARVVFISVGGVFLLELSLSSYGRWSVVFTFALESYSLGFLVLLCNDAIDVECQHINLTDVECQHIDLTDVEC